VNEELKSVKILIDFILKLLITVIKEQVLLIFTVSFSRILIQYII